MSRLHVVSAIGLASIVTGCATAGAPTTAAHAPRAAVACESLPSTLVQEGSFAAPLQVLDARPVTEAVGRQQTGARRGAELAVVAEPGYDANAVERVLACRAQAARAAGSTTDPLAVPGTEIDVRASNGRMHVRIVASDRSGGAEVWSRVAALDL